MKAYGKYSLLVLLGLVTLGAQAELPSKTERVYSLSKIWQEINYTFADALRYNAVNVDSLYQAYLPLVSEIENEYDYYQLLNSFLANFREGHTRIIPPANTPYEFPKLDIELLDNVLYVSDTSESLSNTIPRFSQILKVNGLDALKLLEDSIVPYISATTDRWRKDKAATQLLYGKPATEVTLTVITHSQEELELKLLRNSKSDTTAMLHSRPTMDFNWLNDSILMMSLNTCMDVQGARQTFLAHLNDINTAKGLVIDVRANRGGTEEAWYLPAFLMLNMDSIEYKGCDIFRTTFPSETENGAEPAFSNGTYERIHHRFPYSNGIPAEYRIDTPLVVLSGKFTGSAAEFFVQLMRENHPNLKVIGEPTTGSCSIPKFVPLPGDYTLMIAQAVYCTPEDNIIGHTGIIPDETLCLSFEDVVNGKDPILERAVQILKLDI